MKIYKRLMLSVSDTWSLWKRVFQLFWNLNPKAIVCLLLLLLLGGILPSAQIQVTVALVQSVSQILIVGKIHQLTAFPLFLAILQGLLALAILLISTGQQYLGTILQLQITNAMNTQIMEKAISLDLQHYENDELYDKLQRAHNESGYRPYQIFSQMISLGSLIVSLISVLCIVITWNWLLALIILIAQLPALGSQMFFGQKGYTIEYKRAADRRRLTYLQYLVTNSQAFKEIRLFRLSQLFLQRYKKLIESFYSIDKRFLRTQSLVIVPFDILSVIVVAGAFIYTVEFVLSVGNIGLLAGYIQAVVLIQQSMQGLLTIISQLYQNSLFVKNIFAFFDTPSSTLSCGKRKFPEKLLKGIEFRQVGFRYPGTTRVVFNDLNFFLKAGECVALVGHNGVGKTTIVKLLARLYQPTEGEILIDDVPIEEYDLEDLHKHFGIIFQDFVHYEMTAGENIGFGDVDKLDDSNHIVTAAQKAGIASVIEALPENYSTPLGRMFEQGHELSVGQWQKIALARAFMSRAPIMILDEPTSSIDASSEREIFEKFKEIAHGTTTLLIAHRFSTVRMADRILVFENGQIIEDGNHRTLLQANGTYAQLFHLQASAYAIE